MGFFITGKWLTINVENGSRNSYTNTTYYQYSMKDYSKFGNKIIILCKSGFVNPRTFNKSSTHVSTHANMVYDAHTAKMTVKYLADAETTHL